MTGVLPTELNSFVRGKDEIGLCASILRLRISDQLGTATSKSRGIRLVLAGPVV